jgi:hypothetical protein
MTNYQLVFESVDVDTLNKRSGKVFELLDFYPATSRKPATGLYQTKKVYQSKRLLELLENNLRVSFKVGEAVILEV